MKEHIEVLQFLCGLTRETQALTDLVCDRLATKYSQLGFRSSGYDTQNVFIEETPEIELSLYECELLIHSLYKEVTHSETDLFHNKHINSLASRHKFLFVPSRFYIFRHTVENYAEFHFQANEAMKSDLVGEYAIVTCDQSDFIEKLRIIQKIGKYQKISASHIVMQDVQQNNDAKGVTTLMSQAFEISKSVKIVLIERCTLPDFVYNFISRQLFGSEKLELLYLKGTNESPIHIPLELGRALATMTSLRGLFLEECKIDPGVYKCIVQQLPSCVKIEVLSLHGSEGIPVELGESVRKLKSLRKIKVSCCAMTPAVSKTLLCGLSHSPCFERLIVSNNSLAGCVRNQFGRDHNPGFLALKKIRMRNARLKREDLKALSQAVLAGKIPNLKSLNLSRNVLTDCVADLLRHEIPSLRMMGMVGARLSPTDIQTLCQVVKAGKLPKLSLLNLRDNNLCKMEENVEMLVQSCVLTYKTNELKLNFTDNNLSQNCVRRIKSACQATNVILKL